MAIFIVWDIAHWSVTTISAFLFSFMYFNAEAEFLACVCLLMTTQSKATSGGQVVSRLWLLPDHRGTVVATEELGKTATMSPVGYGALTTSSSL